MIKQWRHILTIGVFLSLMQPAQAAPWWWNWGRSNTAPTISGAPATTVVAGNAYSFTPAASDKEGNTLTFSIANKPAWASFSSSTGKLSGTPTASNVGTSANIVISVSDSKLRSSLPAFSIAVTAATQSTNTAPVISGSPATSVVAGKPYSFVPSASDANGDALSFSITGKPAWAAFSLSSGSLTGTPTLAQAGNYPSIVITVSDGKASKSLAAFGITVTSPSASGTATLSWSMPTQNTDGSSLTNLAGYRIYHGNSASALNEVRTVTDTGATSYQYTALASGTHYFAVSAYNSAGAESALSNVGSKTIP